MSKARRTIVIGDVHGCGTELKSLLALLGFPRPGDHVILVGDLFDRGPVPEQVLETILQHQRTGPAQGYLFEAVCGNHDLDLLACCLQSPSTATSPADIPPAVKAARDRVQALGGLAKLTAYLQALAMVHTVRDPQGAWAVVHAGVDPALGLDATPTEVTRNVRARPDEPAWYDLYDGSDGLIVCGHQRQDEPLIRYRDGRPVVINIDTGCCYGNRLTAYVIEESRFVSVPAEAVYYRPQAKPSG